MHGDSDSQVDWSVLVIATPFLEPVPGSSGTLCAKKAGKSITVMLTLKTTEMFFLFYK